MCFIIMLIAGYLVPNLIIYIANKIKNKYNIKKSKIIYYLIGIWGEKCEKYRIFNIYYE